MKKLATLVAMIATASSLPALGDWAYDMTSEHCSPESRARIAHGVRRQIESSVRRSEASISPPAPVGELGCLEGLMNLSIDSFASVGALGNRFSGSLDGVMDLGDGRRQPFCNLAQRKWNELSKPLSLKLRDLQMGALPGFRERFGVANFPQALLERSEVLESRSAAARIAGGTSGGLQGAESHSDKVFSPRQDQNPNSSPLALPESAAAASIDDLVEEIWKSLYGDGG